MGNMGGIMARPARGEPGGPPASPGPSTGLTDQEGADPWRSRPAHRRPRRRGQILVNLACVLVMLLAVAFIVPAAFGYQRYVITGSSMEGSLGLGSVAFEEVVPVADLEVGDVITYQPPADSGVDHLVTHRIVSIEGDVYRTQGDANADVDPWTFQLTSTSQSRVSYSVPYVGYVFIALQDRDDPDDRHRPPGDGIIALLSLVQLVRAPRAGDPSQPARQPVAKPTVPVGGYAMLRKFLYLVQRAAPRSRRVFRCPGLRRHVHRHQRDPAQRLLGARLDRARRQRWSTPGTPSPAP